MSTIAPHASLGPDHWSACARSVSAGGGDPGPLPVEVDHGGVRPGGGPTGVQLGQVAGDPPDQFGLGYVRARTEVRRAAVVG